ncbi:MAG: 4-(cytidine 5'-diphospho)-2-C-methyl-D-erythritol kinase [Paludibacteraceae bacterium]
MTVYPNAKINIGLNVVERRQDGYHNIETIFYPINLQDELSVRQTDMQVAYRFVSTGIKIGENPENNLIIKALNLLKTHYPFPSVKISLAKHIPFGAGLGGGSSDAAFMLKSLNELFQLNISLEDLEKLASRLGADCPFFIQNKPVFASGIGNIFTPINLSLKGYWLLLVKPEIHVSTPIAYAGVTPTLPKNSLTKLIRQPIETWKDSITNDFEQSVYEKYPEIEKLKKKMYDKGATYASMSGSGSSVYGIFNTKPDEKEFRPTYSHVFSIELC